MSQRNREEEAAILQEFKDVLASFLVIVIILGMIVIAWNLFLIPEPTHVAP